MMRGAHIQATRTYLSSIALLRQAKLGESGARGDSRSRRCVAFLQQLGWADVEGCAL